MSYLKPITLAGVPAALQKANRYRLLNDSSAAESICLDILGVDPKNTEALVTLILAITDQFDHGHADQQRRARDTAEQLSDPYAKAYYSGLVCERWAKAVLRRAVPGAGELAYGWIEKAMALYAEAEKIRPVGDDDAILRWNSCVRLIQSDARLQPHEAQSYEPSFE